MNEVIYKREATIVEINYVKNLQRRYTILLEVLLVILRVVLICSIAIAAIAFVSFNAFSFTNLLLVALFGLVVALLINYTSRFINSKTTISPEKETPLFQIEGPLDFVDIYNSHEETFIQYYIGDAIVSCNGGFLEKMKKGTPCFCEGIDIGKTRNLKDNSRNTHYLLISINGYSIIDFDNTGASI
ncbi:hypothetical protein WSM22_31910 [Cytophagales bacterium WSM2-2]|nr:hypothetical protein WSM22_31910 [Cytophagales bacterium WSM2-2]